MPQDNLLVRTLKFQLDKAQVEISQLKAKIVQLENELRQANPQTFTIDRKWPR